MLVDIPNASRPVRPKQKSENLADEVGIYLAITHIHVTFGTSAVTLPLDA